MFLRYKTCNELEEVFVLIGSSYPFAFSFLQQKWFELAEIPDEFESTTYGAICSNGSSIFITGRSYTLKRFQEYKATNNKWKERDSVCAGRYYHSMVATSYALYALGGKTDTEADTNVSLSSAEKYSFVGQKWKECGNIVQPAVSALAAMNDSDTSARWWRDSRSPNRGSVFWCFYKHSHSVNSTVIFWCLYSQTRSVRWQNIRVWFRWSINGTSETFETMKKTTFSVDSDSYIFQKNGKIYILESEDMVEFDPESGKENIRTHHLELNDDSYIAGYTKRLLKDSIWLVFKWHWLEL